MALINRSSRNDFTFIPITFIRSNEVSSAAKLVYMSVASRRQAGEPDPDLELIAAETGLSLGQARTAEHQLNDLTDEQWLSLGLPL